MSTAAEIFTELDAAARANLGWRGVQRYEEWKSRLMAMGEDVEDIEATLRGFIWDESEEEIRDELEAENAAADSEECP